MALRRRGTRVNSAVLFPLRGRCLPRIFVRLQLQSIISSDLMVLQEVHRCSQGTQRGELELRLIHNAQCHEECRAFRSRRSCLKRSSLKILLQMQLHRRAYMEHEPSQRALIISIQYRRRFIIRLVLCRNLCCPRSSRFNMLRSIHRMQGIFHKHFRKIQGLSIRRRSQDFHRLRCILLLAFSLTRRDLSSLLPG